RSLYSFTTRRSSDLYFLTKEHIQLIKTKGLKIVGLLFTLVLFAFIYITINVDVTLDTDWLSGAAAYRSLEAEISGGLMRLIIYILASCLIVRSEERRVGK